MSCFIDETSVDETSVNEMAVDETSKIILNVLRHHSREYQGESLVFTNFKKIEFQES